MEINLIRIGHENLETSILHEDDLIIEEINNILFDNDYYLKENANSSISVLFAESDDYSNVKISSLLKIDAPIIILYGKDNSAYKASLELNSYFMIHKKYSLVGAGSLEENATIISEVARVNIAKDKLYNANIALIGKDDNKSILNKIDTKFISETYKVNIIKISNDEFLEATKVAKKSPIYHKNIIDDVIKNKSDHAKFQKYYSALDYLIDKYQLSGICFSYSPNHDFDYPLAALFNERGYSFILDYDLYSLISLMVINALNESIGLYGTLLKVDLAENSIHLLVNMVPFNMLMNENMALNNGDITLYKIGYDNRSFLAIEGKITSSSEYDGSIKVEIKLDDHLLFDFFRDPVGASFAFCYGDYTGSLVAYQNLVNIKNIK